MKPTKIYQRLRGTGFQSETSVRLYVGPDHLLQVMSNGFTETYKRFFFQDIQTISCQRTGTWHAWTILWAFSAFVWAVGGIQTGVLLPFLMAGISVAVLLINLRLGPSCACYIQTAVQTQHLPSLRRLGQARRVIEKLRPLITQAQGELSSEEALARLGGIPIPRAPVQIQEPATSAPEPPPEQRNLMT